MLHELLLLSVDISFILEKVTLSCLSWLHALLHALRLMHTEQDWLAITVKWVQKSIVLYKLPFNHFNLYNGHTTVRDNHIQLPNANKFGHVQNVSE